VAKNEDFIVSIGADSGPFFDELLKVKRGLVDALSPKQLNLQFKDAVIGDLKRVAKEAGQIKFDTIGTNLYKTLSTSIDEAFAPRASRLEVIPSRNADTGRFQRGGTDVVASDKEQQAAIVASMRARYAEEDVLRERSYQGAKTRNEFELQQNETLRRAELAGLKQAILARDELSKIDQERINQLPRLRYALYDVANSLNTMSDATLGVISATVKLNAEYETAFTSIQRTTMATEPMLKSLEGQLLNLARQIPLTFGDITTIGSLGAQLGIADGDIAGFTKTVAEFAATTNVSVESAAESFGALGNLLDISAGQYANLGSSIAYVGINSAATETQVLSVVTAISAVATSAGMSEDYVIGLSGALASLKVPAEQSRGALTRVFQEINRAAVAGGEDMARYAAIIGTTTEEASRLATTDIETFFNKFLAGLGSMDTQQLTSALDALNLSDIRVTNTLTRLSQNLDVTQQNLDNAAYGFQNAGLISELYAKKVEDLASKLQLLQNSAAELGSTIGGVFSPIIGAIVDDITASIQSLTDALGTDAGQRFVAIVGSITALIGVLTLVASKAALARAAIAAFETAINVMGLQTATKGFAGFAAAIAGVTTSTNMSAAAIRNWRIALASTGIGVLILALGQLSAAYQESANSAENAFLKYMGDTAGLTDALIADTNAYNSAVAAGNTSAANSFAKVTYAADGTKTKMSEAQQQVAYTAEALGMMLPSSVGVATSALEYNTRAIGDNTIAWAQNQLMKSEEFQKLAGNEDFVNFVKKTGFNLMEQLKIQQEQGSEAAYQYYVSIAQAAYDGGKISIDEVGRVDSVLASQLRGTSETITASTDPTSYAMSYLFQGLGQAITQGATWVLAQLGDFGKGIADFLYTISGGSVNLTGAVNSLVKTGEGFLNQAAILPIELPKATSALTDMENGFTGAGNAAGSASQKIRTLVDYANDLSTVWSRAFDIRFSAGSALDEINKSWQDMAQSISDANKEIDDLNTSIGELTADKALQEYFLQVAEAQGDMISAARIRANLAKINSQLTDQQEQLADAQANASKTLVGNSAAAIANRKTIRDMVQGYQSYIQSLASSGASQEELSAATTQAQADFIAQATQLGYNSDELGTYAVAFDDVSTAIDNVPRDITVTANTNPALQALNEYEAKLREMSGKTYSGGTVSSPNFGNNARMQELEALIARYSAWATQLANSRNIPGADKALDAVRRYSEELVSLRGYATGGYTGAGGMYEVAGVVHRGEYVVPKSEVNQATGLPYWMSQAPKFYSGGSTTSSNSGGNMMVSLSPEDRSILRSAGGSGNIVLYADSRELARSVNDGNRQIVAQGGRP